MITGPQITAGRASTGVNQTKLSIRSGLDLAAEYYLARPTQYPREDWATA